MTKKKSQAKVSNTGNNDDNDEWLETLIKDDQGNPKKNTQDERKTGRGKAKHSTQVKYNNSNLAKPASRYLQSKEGQNHTKFHTETKFQSSGGESIFNPTNINGVSKGVFFPPSPSVNHNIKNNRGGMYNLNTNRKDDNYHINNNLTTGLAAKEAQLTDRDLHKPMGKNHQLISEEDVVRADGEPNFLSPCRAVRSDELRMIQGVESDPESNFDMGSTKYKSSAAARFSRLSNRSREASTSVISNQGAEVSSNKQIIVNSTGNEFGIQNSNNPRPVSSIPHNNDLKLSDANVNLNDAHNDNADELNQSSSLSKNNGLSTTFAPHTPDLANSTDYMTPTFVTWINGQAHYCFIVKKDRANEEIEKAKRLNNPVPLRVDEYPKKELIPCHLPVKWVSTDSYPPAVVHQWWPQTFFGDTESSNQFNSIDAGVAAASSVPAVATEAMTTDTVKDNRSLGPDSFVAHLPSGSADDIDIISPPNPLNKPVVASKTKPNPNAPAFVPSTNFVGLPTQTAAPPRSYGSNKPHTNTSVSGIPTAQPTILPSPTPSVNPIKSSTSKESIGRKVRGIVQNQHGKVTSDLDSVVTDNHRSNTTNLSPVEGSLTDSSPTQGTPLEENTGGGFISWAAKAAKNPSTKITSNTPSSTAAGMSHRASHNTATGGTSSTGFPGGGNSGSNGGGGQTAGIVRAESHKKDGGGISRKTSASVELYTSIDGSVIDSVNFEYSSYYNLSSLCLPDQLNYMAFIRKRERSDRKQNYKVIHERMIAISHMLEKRKTMRIGNPLDIPNVPIKVYPLGFINRSERNECYRNTVLQALLSLGVFVRYILAAGRCPNPIVYPFHAGLFRLFSYCCGICKKEQACATIEGRSKDAPEWTVQDAMNLIRYALDPNASYNIQPPPSVSVNVSDFMPEAIELWLSKSDRNMGAQEDAEEFLRFVISQLEEEVNWTSSEEAKDGFKVIGKKGAAPLIAADGPSSPMDYIFGILKRDYVQKAIHAVKERTMSLYPAHPVHKEYMKHSEDAPWDLVSMISANLQENVDINPQWGRRTKLERLPPVLQLIIHRADFHRNMNHALKLTNSVDIPDIFGISDEYLGSGGNERDVWDRQSFTKDALLSRVSKEVPSYRGLKTLEGLKQRGASVLQSVKDAPSNTIFYELKSMLLHTGHNVASGHYVAMAKRGLPGEEGLTMFDDTEVQQKVGSYDRSEAYVLIYQRINNSSVRMSVE